MSEDLERRIEEHMDDFADYERPDPSQEPEKREAAVEARRGAVGVVLDAIDAAGYRVESREFLKELQQSNNRRLDRIRVLERQVREGEETIESLARQLALMETAADDAGVSRSGKPDPVTRVQTMGRMLTDMKNKADVARAGVTGQAPEDEGDPLEGYEARDAQETVDRIIEEEDAREESTPDHPRPADGLPQRQPIWEPRDMPRPDERPGERPEAPTPPTPRDPDKDGGTG